MRTHVRSLLGPAAGLLLLLPTSAFANPINVNWTADNALGANQVTLRVQLVCSTACSTNQIQTSFLTGSGTGTLDEVLESITLDTFVANGTNIAYNIPAIGNIAVSNLTVSLLQAASGGIPGYDINQSNNTQLQSIGTSLSGGEWEAFATTNNSALEEIQLAQVISTQATLIELGQTPDGNLNFHLQNLRGSFQFLTVTQTVSVLTITIRTTFRATFTMNLRGVAVPEPGTFVLLGGGVLAFAAAARRRAR